MPPSTRRVSTAAQKFELLLLVEGEVTEEQYLNHYARRVRDRVNVQISDVRGTPMTLVKEAVQARTRDLRTERRGRGRARDAYWCVFDEDSHPHLEEAITLAEANQINIALTSPCIELWFLIHFRDQHAFIERREAQSAARDYTGCEKSLSREALEALRENFDDAKARAIWLDDKHAGDGTPTPANPSSGMWRLIDAITDVHHAHEQASS